MVTRDHHKCICMLCSLPEKQSSMSLFFFLLLLPANPVCLGNGFLDDIRSVCCIQRDLCAPTEPRSATLERLVTTFTQEKRSSLVVSFLTLFDPIKKTHILWCSYAVWAFCLGNNCHGDKKLNGR